MVQRLVGLFCLLVALMAPADARHICPILCGSKTAAALPPPAIDGISNLGGPGTSSTMLLTLSTTKTNDVVIIHALCNLSSVSGVSDVAGLTWAKRASIGAGANDIEEWFAKSAAPLTGDAITVQCGAGVFNLSIAFAVSGTNFASPFDPGGPQTSATGTLSITTTHAKTFVIAAARFSSTTAPTAGAGWTPIISGTTGTFYVSEYKILTTTATTSLSTSNNADVNGSVMDAVYSQ